MNIKGKGIANIFLPFLVLVFWYFYGFLKVISSQSLKKQKNVCACLSLYGRVEGLGSLALELSMVAEMEWARRKNPKGQRGGERCLPVKGKGSITTKKTPQTQKTGRHILHLKRSFEAQYYRGLSVVSFTHRKLETKDCCFPIQGIL